MVVILITGLYLIPKAQTSDYDKRLRSNMATKIPTIDGNMGTEWSDARDNTKTVGSIPSDVHIYIKNTATTLYIAMKIQDDYDTDDKLYLNFDEENDETYKVLEMGGEDYREILADGTYDDWFYEPSLIAFDTVWSGTEDGTCGWYHDGTYWEIEMTIPINFDGDPYDVNIHSGCAIGFFLRYYDSSSSTMHNWPSGASLGIQTLWGNICTARVYEGYIPHADDRTAWKAFLSVSNTGHATSTIIIQFEDGTIATRTVAPGSSTKGFVSSFKGSDYVGPIKIWSNQSFTALLNQRNSGSTVGYTTVIQGEN